MRRSLSDTRARCLGVVFDGRAQATGIRKRGSDATMLLIVNAHHDVVLFTLPRVAAGRAWLRLIDTNLDHVEDEIGAVRLKFGHVYNVTGRSLLLFRLLHSRRQNPTPPSRTAPKLTYTPPSFTPPSFQPSKQPSTRGGQQQADDAHGSPEIREAEEFSHHALSGKIPTRERRPNTNGGAGDLNDGALPPTNQTAFTFVLRSLGWTLA